MAENNSNAKPQPEKPVRKYAPKPLTSDGSIDRDAVKTLYMASSHVEWTPFAESIGWNPMETRIIFPWKEWREEKKKILGTKRAEELAELVFDHQGRWHKEIITTLKVYPTIADQAMVLLQYKIQEFQDMWAEDQKAKARAKPGERPASKFAEVTPADMRDLMMALRTAIDAKHQALLIKDWSPKIAEMASAAITSGDPQKDEENREWKVSLLGADEVSSRDLEKFLTHWYDPPHKDVTMEEVEAQESQEKAETNGND